MKIVFVCLIKQYICLHNLHATLHLDAEYWKQNQLSFYDQCPKELSFVKTIKEKSENKCDETDKHSDRKQVTVLAPSWFEAVF